MGNGMRHSFTFFFIFLNGLFFTTAGLALSQSVEPLTAEQDWGRRFDSRGGTNTLRS